MQIRCRKTTKGWVIENYHRNQNKWEKLFDTYFDTRAQAMNKTVRDEVSLWYDLWNGKKTLIHVADTCSEGKSYAIKFNDRKREEAIRRLGR